MYGLPHLKKSRVFEVDIEFVIKRCAMSQELLAVRWLSAEIVNIRAAHIYLQRGSLCGDLTVAIESRLCQYVILLVSIPFISIG